MSWGWPEGGTSQPTNGSVVTQGLERCQAEDLNSKAQSTDVGSRGMLCCSLCISRLGNETPTRCTCTRHFPPFLLQDPHFTTALRGCGTLQPLPSFSWSQQEPREVASPHATDWETEAGPWSKGTRGAACPCPKPGSSLLGSQVGATGWAPFAMTRNVIPWALNPYKRSPMFHIKWAGPL